VKEKHIREEKGGMNSVHRTLDLAVIVPATVEVASPDGCENFQPPLAFRLDIKELV
jgi:hypothetical protein